MRQSATGGGHGPTPVPPVVRSGPGDAARGPTRSAAGALGGLERIVLPGVDDVREDVLGNGVRVLSERIATVRSASVGVWVRRGSAHEAIHEMGSSHLLEHMVFKGTERRSPREIALALEGLGGSLDAYTSREHTSFQARVLDEHLPQALDVLADLTLAPRLRENDLDLERQVVLEEIATVEDTPDDLVFELLGERLWNGHPYGHRILGTPDTVRRIGAADLRAVHRSTYVGENLVVAAAGNIDHGRLVELATDLFGHIPPGERLRPVDDPGPLRAGDERAGRETAQSHVVFAGPAVRHSDPLRYAMVLLSAALGGGMSSRMFQRVREELALAYTVYSFQSFYARGGLAGVYVGTRPEWEERAIEAIRGEYARVRASGLEREELDQTKRQVKGQIMLSLESSGARLHRLAAFALYEEPYQTLDDLLARVDAVTADDVAEVAERYYDPERQLVLRLGPDGSSR